MASVNGTQYDDVVSTAGSSYYRNGKKAGALANATAGDDIISTGNGNDQVSAGAGNDIVAGGNGNDILRGEAGNDTLWGDSLGNPDANDNGQDQLFGGTGNDLLHGGNGKDYLDGGADDDQLFGDNGSDALSGGDGSDVLNGGNGGDVLTGGSGGDRFVFTTNSRAAVSDSPYSFGAPGTVSGSGIDTVWVKAWDVVTDFASGIDKIDLTQLATTAGHELIWRGAHNDDSAAGMARAPFAYGVWTDAANNFLYADINGDGKADLKVQVANVGFGDLDGVVRDSTPPTVVVDIIDTQLSDGDHQSTVTFSFSEYVLGFSEADIGTEHGMIVAGSLTTSDGGKTWSAQFIADDAFDGPGRVSVTDGSFVDYSGNDGIGGSDSVAIDTDNPTVAIDFDDTLVSDADEPAGTLVTFTFAADVDASTVDRSQISVSNGSFDSATWSAVGNVLTVVFHAADGFEGSATIGIAGSAYRDDVGNVGVAASAELSIDTANPTVSIDIGEASLSDAVNSSLVTISFSEAVSGFDIDDLGFKGGTLSSFTMIDASHYTAIFTALDDYDSNDGIAPEFGAVAIVGGTYSDAAGNSGVEAFDEVDIDTKNPTVTVDIAAATLTDASPSTVVTFTFSEAVSNFSLADVSELHGTLSGLATSDFIHWTANYVANDGFDGSDTISVAAGGYTDAVGNVGAGGSDTVAIDRFEAVSSVASIRFVPGTNNFAQNSDAIGVIGTMMAYDANGDPVANAFTAGLYGGGDNLTLAADGTLSFTGQTNNYNTTITLFGQKIHVQVGTGTGQTMTFVAGQSDAIQILLGVGGADTVTGGTNGDVLYGGNSSDVLVAGNGDDYLFGGAGADTLTGGAGHDRFVYQAGDSGPNAPTRDTITDFQSGDVIDLDALGLLGLSNSATTSVNAANWYQSGGNTFIAADTDGNGSADFLIQLNGLHTLSTSDILL